MPARPLQAFFTPTLEEHLHALAQACSYAIQATQLQQLTLPEKTTLLAGIQSQLVSQGEWGVTTKLLKCLLKNAKISDQGPLVSAESREAGALVREAQTVFAGVAAALPSAAPTLPGTAVGLLAGVLHQQGNSMAAILTAKTPIDSLRATRAALNNIEEFRNELYKGALSLNMSKQLNGDHESIPEEVISILMTIGLYLNNFSASLSGGPIASVVPPLEETPLEAVAEAQPPRPEPRRRSSTSSSFSVRSLLINALDLAGTFFDRGVAAVGRIYKTEAGAEAQPPRPEPRRRSSTSSSFSVRSLLINALDLAGTFFERGVAAVGRIYKTEAGAEAQPPRPEPRRRSSTSSSFSVHSLLIDALDLAGTFFDRGVAAARRVYGSLQDIRRRVTRAERDSDVLSEVSELGTEGLYKPLSETSSSEVESSGEEVESSEGIAGEESSQLEEGIYEAVGGEGSQLEEGIYEAVGGEGSQLEEGIYEAVGREGSQVGTPEGASVRPREPRSQAAPPIKPRPRPKEEGKSPAAPPIKPRPRPKEEGKSPAKRALPRTPEETASLYAVVQAPPPSTEGIYEPMAGTSSSETESSDEEIYEPMAGTSSSEMGSSEEGIYEPVGGEGSQLEEGIYEAVGEEGSQVGTSENKIYEAVGEEGSQVGTSENKIYEAAGESSQAATSENKIYEAAGESSQVGTPEATSVRPRTFSMPTKSRSQAAGSIKPGSEEGKSPAKRALPEIPEQGTKGSQAAPEATSVRPRTFSMPTKSRSQAAGSIKPGSEEGKSPAKRALPEIPEQGTKGSQAATPDVAPPKPPLPWKRQSLGDEETPSQHPPTGALAAAVAGLEGVRSAGEVKEGSVKGPDSGTGKEPSGGAQR